eukprot:UN22200
MHLACNMHLTTRCPTLKVPNSLCIFAMVEGNNYFVLSKSINREAVTRNAVHFNISTISVCVFVPECITIHNNRVATVRLRRAACLRFCLTIVMAALISIVLRRLRNRKCSSLGSSTTFVRTFAIVTPRAFAIDWRRNVRAKTLRVRIQGCLARPTTSH